MIHVEIYNTCTPQRVKEMNDDIQNMEEEGYVVGTVQTAISTRQKQSDDVPDIHSYTTVTFIRWLWIEQDI